MYHPPSSTLTELQSELTSGKSVSEATTPAASAPGSRRVSEEFSQELASIKKQLSKAERDYVRCREDKDELEERFKADLKLKEKEVDRAIRKEKERCDRAEQELKVQITSLETDLEDAKERHEGTTRQHDISQKKLGEASQELAQTRASIQTLEAEVQQVQKDGLRQLERVKNEKVALQTRLSEVEQRFQKELQMTQKENERNFDLFVEEKTTCDTNFNERVDRLHKEVVGLESHIAELHAKTEQKTQELKASEAAHQATKVAAQRLAENHRTTLAESNKETERVRSEKDALFAKIESLSQSNKDALAAAEDRHTEMLQVTQDEWKTDQAERVARITDLAAQLEQSRAVANEATAKLDEMARESDTQHRTNTELQKEIAALKSSHERTVAELRASNERALKEKSVLAEEIKTLHRRFAEDLQKHRQHSQEDVDSVLSEKKTSDDDFQSQINLLLTQITQYEGRAIETDARHSEEMKDHRSSLNAEKAAVTQLRAEKSKADARFDKFRQQYERRIEKMTKHHDELVANLRTEKDRQISVLDTELEANKENLLDQMRAAATLAVEIDSLNASHQTEIEDLQSHAQLLRLEKSKLEASIVKQREDHREAVIKLEERYRENEEVFNAHKLQVEEAQQQRLEELIQKIREVEERLLNSEQDLQEARQHLAAKESDIASFELQRQALESAKNAEVENLERELARWRDKCKVTEEQIAASRTAYEADVNRASDEYQNHLSVVIDEKKVADGKFEARLDELTNAYNESQRENSTLKIKMNEVYAKTETILKSSARDAQLAQTEKQVLLDRLESQEDLSKTQRNSMQIEHESAVDRLQKQLEKMQTDENMRLNELTQTLSQLELELSNSHTESKELKSLFEKSKLDHALLTIDKKDLTEAREKLSAELRHASAVSTEKEGALRERLQKTRATHEEEMKRVSEEFKNTLRMYEDSREGMKQRINNERDDLHRKNADLSRTNSELCDKVEASRQELDQLERRVNGLLDQTDMMKKVNAVGQSDTSAELSRIRGERDSLHKERELLKEQFEENMQSARDQWQRQVKEYKKDRDELTLARTEIDKYKHDLENEQKRSETVQQKFDISLENFNKEMRQTNSSQSSLAAEKQQAVRDNVSLRASLAELNRELAEKSEEQLKYIEQIRMLQYQGSNSTNSSSRKLDENLQPQMQNVESSE